MGSVVHVGEVELSVYIFLAPDFTFTEELDHLTGSVVRRSAAKLLGGFRFANQHSGVDQASETDNGGADDVGKRDLVVLRHGINQS
jgi:hypothetical protein